MTDPVSSERGRSDRSDVTKPKTARRVNRLQIGIGAMLVLVIISALISAGLVYAARIPEIQEELSVLFGTEVTADRTRRGPQILFILFTITSPLLLAMLLSVGSTVWAKISHR